MGIGRVRAVFLDRDGVLNLAVIRDGLPYPPKGIEGLTLAPGAAQALGRLKQAGFLLLVVTNQPEVARGLQTRSAVESLNAAIASELPIDGIFVCWHDDDDDCPAASLSRDCSSTPPGAMESTWRTAFSSATDGATLTPARPPAAVPC